MVGESGRSRLFFRKRTSCAADLVVIEMLRELDSDVWETIANCFQFRLLNHWTEDTDSVWKNTAGHHGQEKEWQAHDVGFPSGCDAPDCLQALLKDVVAAGERGSAIKTWSQYGHVPGRQAHEVVWMLRRVVEQATEWLITVFVMV